jgi:hypothetical protein
MAPPLSAFVWLRVTTITFVYAESQDKPIPDFEEPSPLLFERAMFDVDQHRFRAANLTLQTLIHTYPDSEYASKAKQALDDPRIATVRRVVDFFPTVHRQASGQRDPKARNFSMTVIDGCLRLFTVCNPVNPPGKER